MLDKYVASLNEYKVLNKNNPIGYVRDLTSCIGVIVHKNGESLIGHIEAYGPGEFDKKFFEEMLHGEVDIVEIFKAELTSEENISILCDILNDFELSYVIKDVFVDNSNQTSVGYNYNTCEYLVVTMEGGTPIFNTVFRLKN